jgi:hypothetical protein
MIGWAYVVLAILARTTELKTLPNVSLQGAVSGHIISTTSCMKRAANSGIF